MDNTSCIGVIGGGYWGKNLIRNFFELNALSLICDTDTQLANIYREKYPDIRFTRKQEEVFNDPRIKAVVISTPAVLHFELAKKALHAGKDVFVEKPLALTIEEGKELAALVKSSGKILMVGHILQYHSAILKLKELIDDGILGKIQYIYSNRLSIGKIRSEENILWSFAPHDISIILMLLGEAPMHVQANGGEYLQKEIADVTLTWLEFLSGVKAHIFVSWLHPFKEQKLIVVGDKKMAVFDDCIDEKLLLYPHKIEWKQRVPIANKAQGEIVKFTQKEPLKAECEHFLQCIEKRMPPRTDVYEGLNVLRVLTALQNSLNASGQKIDLVTLEPSVANKKRKPYFSHTTACIDDNCTIGEDTKIWHFAHIMQGSTIGSHCTIGQNVVIGPKVTIGKGCKIQNNVSIYEGVTLEDEVFCGPSMVFTNVFNPRSPISRMSELRPTHIKKGATIGANATIICGHTIGSYAFIAAGAVVTHDVPDYALVMGNPARVKGWMCACGIKIIFNNEKEGTCPECGTHYKKYNNRVEPSL
ncbi:MAG: Gfo/Idh/MocA family oxidoreductase [bacterium]